MQHNALLYKVNDLHWLSGLLFYILQSIKTRISFLLGKPEIGKCIA